MNVEQGLLTEGDVDNFVRRHQRKTWMLSIETLNPSTTDYIITERNFHDTVIGEGWKINPSMNSLSE
jgi:hypothetical protein